jgi:hypothetical protein
MLQLSQVFEPNLIHDQPWLLPNSYLEIGVKVASNFEHEMFASLKTTS